MPRGVAGLSPTPDGGSWCWLPTAVCVSSVLMCTAPAPRAGPWRGEAAPTGAPTSPSTPSQPLAAWGSQTAREQCDLKRTSILKERRGVRFLFIQNVKRIV